MRILEEKTSRHRLAHGMPVKNCDGIRIQLDYLLVLLVILFFISRDFKKLFNIIKKCEIFLIEYEFICLRL